MVTLKNLLLTASLCAFAGSAQAVIIDFVDLAEGSLGESGWSTLSINELDFTLDITAKKGAADAFAYLDYGHAGLGVCGLLYSDKEGFRAEGSNANVCNPSSDDNVTGDTIAGIVESLIFTFDTDVIVNRIWFNNTHDPDRHIGGAGHETDRIDIDGVATPGPGNGYAPGSSHQGIYSSSDLNSVMSDLVRSSLTIAFNNQQFYVSAMEVTLPGGGGSEIPAPGVLSLFGLGMLGLGYVRRRKA